MGSGASAELEGALGAASVDGIKEALAGLNDEQRKKLTSALANNSGTDKPDKLDEALSNRMENLFKRIDLDRSGLLDKSELVKLAKEGGQTEAAAQVLLECCDTDKDDKVSPVEWKAMFKKEAERSNGDMLELLTWFEELATVLQNQRMENLFARIDLDRSGFLDKPAMVKFCQAEEMGSVNMGSNPPPDLWALTWCNEAAEQALRESCDTNVDGKVSMAEWKAMFAKESVRSDTEMVELLVWFEDIAVGLQNKRIQNLFTRVDFDQSAFLDKSELVTFCQEGGQNEAAAQALLESCDTNADGKVSMAEWKAMFARESARSDTEMVKLLMWFEEMATALEKER